jgi:HEPN domain-containing protein/predicted nucleotidyltransferase
MMANNFFQMANQNEIINLRYKAWIKQAEYDLLASNLSLENGYFEWSTYQSAQSVEKMLKAVLVHAGWRAPKVHKIPILLSICNQVNPEFKNTEFKFKHLESFTFISRYPFLIPGKNLPPHELITYKDAARALEQAKEIYEKIVIILDHPNKIEYKDVDLSSFYSEEEINIRIKEIVASIRSILSPIKIILFGSFARKKQYPKTGTMDILIIADTDMTFFERIKEVRKATRGKMPVIEPLVYTKSEFEQMINEEGEGFLETAIEEGIVIYEMNQG